MLRHRLSTFVIGVLALVIVVLAPVILAPLPRLRAQRLQMPAPAKLPIVTAYTLDKKKVSLPTDFSAPLNLLILSFTRDQQDAVESWLPAPVHPWLRLWILPISGRQDVLYRWWLDSSMRSSLPPDEPKHSIVPLYVNQPRFFKALAIASKKQIVVLVTDKSGLVLWRSEGAATSSKQASLAQFLKTSPLAH